ncbi:DUF3151 domain-containing protein [Paramicrobacterium chengjingii]|uniref:DUF3151 domain-containing protein n=1 Tax=Paramicrobacterium chengjingii TaxID=2769067 RepID=A0ABX6YG06_9MICO|nr:DUF3151 domain-containing protein [Microbacterium chengjingii]QPZ37733.1 DUF3151 domain-containing protein [Microbacterium chengjingii]
MTENNLLGVPETHLPAEPEVETALEGAETVDAIAQVVKQHPSSALAWAVYAEHILHPAHPLEGYAAARVAYHRGLDSLRKAGWRGQGPVPWSHEPNRGVLRALYALRRAAAMIDEADEVDRLDDFLRGADDTAAARIELLGTTREPAPSTETFVIRGED